MRCARCGGSLVAAGPTACCPSCDATRYTAPTRRQFLVQTGLLGLSALGLGVIAGCPSNDGGSGSLDMAGPHNSFDLTWSVHNPFGIAVPPQLQRQTWVGGHVNDLIELDATTVLAASETSGVWLLSSGGTAAALSLDWDAPRLRCLVRGPYGASHVYAGGSDDAGNGALWVTDVRLAAPIVGAWQRIPLPVVGDRAIGEVFRIVIVGRKIVLATATGLYWSEVPATPGLTGYDWGVGGGGAVLGGAGFFSVAAGPGESIIAGTLNPNNGLPAHAGLYLGSWVNGSLFMSRGAFDVFDAARVGTASVASWEGDRRIAYAVAAAADGTIGGVYRTSDGGASWRTMAATLYDGAGNPMNMSIGAYSGVQGGAGYDNCIAVAPSIDGASIAIGWVTGPLLSTDGGGSFRAIDRNLTHDDKHAIVFSAGPNPRLYVASDGGVARSDDLGRSFTYDYNRQLANLQFYTDSFDYSRDVAGLVGGGLQDNDDVYCAPDGQGGVTPWLSIGGTVADGGPFRFPSGLPALWSDGYNLFHSSWDGARLTGTDQYNVSNDKPGGSLSGSPLKNASLWPVYPPSKLGASPRYLFALACLYAFKGRPRSDEGDVYGLTANPDGSDPRWDYLFHIPLSATQTVESIGVYAGREIDVFVGLGGPAQIIRFDILPSGDIGHSTLWNPLVQTGPDMNNLDEVRYSSIRRIALNTRNVVALYHRYYGDNTGPRTESRVLISAGNGFDFTPTAPPLDELTSLELDPDNSDRIFVAGDRGVLASRDNGRSWEDVSHGLPRRVWGNSLRLLHEPGGARALYLATYGWSVWKARIA